MLINFNNTGGANLQKPNIIIIIPMTKVYVMLEPLNPEAKFRTNMDIIGQWRESFYGRP